MYILRKKKCVNNNKNTITHTHTHNTHTQHTHTHITHTHTHTHTTYTPHTHNTHTHIYIYYAKIYHTYILRIHNNTEEQLGVRMEISGLSGSNAPFVLFHRKKGERPFPATAIASIYFIWGGYEGISDGVRGV